MKTDAQLETAVLERIRTDERVMPSEIGVTIHDGVATLKGEVDSLAKRLAAARAAASTPGVTAITNDINVRIPRDQRRSDLDIEHDVVNALAWDTEVPDNTIKARVQDRWVWLIGECDWNYQREAAQRAIENVAGVRGVVNAVRIKRAPPNLALQTEIEQAIARHAVLSSRIIKVAVRDGTAVVLAGTVQSADERAAAEQVSWSASGVTSIEDRIHVAASSGEFPDRVAKRF
jgi:osmotically-inducible protein OsmY